MMNSLVPQRTQNYLRIRNFRSQKSDKLSPGSIFQIFQMEIMQTEKKMCISRLEEITVMR